MKRVLPLCFWVLLSMPSCTKEALTSMGLTKPSPKEDTPSSYVNVFFPGDTSNGVTHALKNQSVWKAKAYGDPYVRNTKIFWSAEFYTYASDLVSLREVVGFEGLPDDCEGKIFTPKRFNGTLIPTAYYLRLYADGDLGKDLYDLDTTATDNYIRINKLDRGRKFIVGEYRLTFNIKKPRIDPENPLRVKFESGYFGAKFEW